MTEVGKFLEKLFRILFYLHLILVTILTIFLTIRGLLSAFHTHHFHPEKWYPPLLTSTACAGFVAFIWQWITLCNPSKAIRSAFWLSPLLTCAVGILLISVGSAGSLAAGVVAVIFAIIQSLYTCWVNPRFMYASRVLSVSIASPPPKTSLLVILSITLSLVYSCFLVSGIGGATAAGTGLDSAFIFIILLSLALHATFKHSIGKACIGSALVPILGFIRGSARTMKLIAGETDEFLFSCVNCYSGVASTLIAYGNRWGFVHVGVSNKEFVQASINAWETFKRVGLVPLIDSDLGGAFCFLSGVTGGAICALAGGSWALVVHRSYAIEVSLYAFLIGYFMCRVAMAWPQACISAYYIAYADNPQSFQFDSTIPDRIQQLQRSQA